MADRPAVNVGHIGHIDHGKHTLTAALARVAGQLMTQENSMQSEQKVKIAVVGTGMDSKLVARMIAAIKEKGHEVVDDPADATHVIGKEGIDDFSKAEQMAARATAQQIVGRTPWGKAKAKLARKERLKKLQREAFLGE